MRDEPDVAVVLAEGLDGGLVIQQRRDDVSVLGRVLFANDHEVAVADRGVHHRIAMHLQHEQVAGAGQAFGQAHDVVDMLFRGDGHACGDASDQRHVARRRDGFRAVLR